MIQASARALYAYDHQMSEPNVTYEPCSLEERFSIRAYSTRVLPSYGINREDVDYIMDTFPL